MCVCQQVMLTSLPIILYPLFDSDVPKDVAAVSPQLYKPGLTRMHFTRSKMFYWLAEAAYAAVVVTCWWPFLLAADMHDSLGESSMITMWLVCTVVNTRLVLENNSWTWIDYFGVFSMFAMLLIWSAAGHVLSNYAPAP